MKEDLDVETEKVRQIDRKRGEKGWEEERGWERSAVYKVDSAWLAGFTHFSSKRPEERWAFHFHLSAFH